VHFLHPNLPFGGVNNSGIGNAHGEYGFRAFSHERAVVRTRFMMARTLFPPYTKFKSKMLDIMIKTQ
ncbi:MAG TPA: aldehyde dehydrogenase, partial [Gammaproteobacteria bacterium]|nr:aldehyde dehydrogenase [Gammaproteobacteria bacterium]MCH77148.1 aldehyde dehydrogenase [Gammaproteobacteria bacterium]